jgi:hypothetical protein
MANKAPRSWGYWTEGKLDILGRYLDRFTTTTKYKADARIYLDAFAGQGLGTSRTTRAQFEGSARIGLKVGDPPFDRCYFFELREKAAELERELTRDFPGRDLRVVPGDCNETIPDALAELRRDNLGWAPTFAFLDPDGMELRWETIKALAVHKRLRQPPSKTKVELWLLFPQAACSATSPWTTGSSCQVMSPRPHRCSARTPGSGSTRRARRSRSTARRHANGSSTFTGGNSNETSATAGPTPSRSRTTEIDPSTTSFSPLTAIPATRS